MYKKEQFKNCQFNPLEEGVMVELYPQLVELVDMDKIDADIDSILRYVIILYDPNSPVVKNEKDFPRRRELAFELSCISEEGLVAAMCAHVHDYLPELVVSYLKRFPRSKEYAVICAMEYTFWESIKKLFEPIAGKDSKSELESVQKKSSIKDEIDKDIDRLESYYRRFFAGDEELEKRAKHGFKPEDMNKALQAKINGK